MHLPDLRKQDPTTAITADFGGCCCEAATVCLESRAHASGVSMPVTGAWDSHSARVTWTAADDQMRRCYADMQFATEFGAYGVAALMVETLTGMSVIERSRKGRGFDFWLGPKGSSEPLFQDKSKMEVSGILDGDETEMRARMRAKLAQLVKGGLALQGYGVVVHFGTPESRVATP